MSNSLLFPLSKNAHFPRGRSDIFVGGRLVTVLQGGDVGIRDIENNNKVIKLAEHIQNIVGVFNEGLIIAKKKDLTGVVIDVGKMVSRDIFRFPELTSWVTECGWGMLGIFVYDVFDDQEEIGYLDFEKKKITWSRAITLDDEPCWQYLYDQTDNSIFLIFNYGRVERHILSSNKSAEVKKINVSSLVVFPILVGQYVCLFDKKNLFVLDKLTLNLVEKVEFAGVDYAWLDEGGGNIYTICAGDLIIFDSKQIDKKICAIRAGDLNEIDFAFFKKNRSIANVKTTKTHFIVAYTEGVVVAISRDNYYVDWFERFPGTFPYKTNIQVGGNRLLLQTHEAMSPGTYYNHTFEGVGGFRADEL